MTLRSMLLVLCFTDMLQRFGNPQYWEESSCQESVEWNGGMEHWNGILEWVN